MIKVAGCMLCALLPLAGGCQGDSTPAPVPKLNLPAKASAGKRGPTPEELTAGMVEAVPMGKTSVPVGVKFDLPTRPAVGQPLDIIVALLPQVIGTASLQITGSEGLKLAPDVGTIAIPAIEPNQAYRMTIAATPTSEGVQLLSVSVSVTHGDATDTRTFAVPVIVAAADAAADQAAGTSGEPAAAAAASSDTAATPTVAAAATAAISKPASAATATGDSSGQATTAGSTAR